MLKISQVAITYPNATQPALNNISLEVERGDLVAIIGESGCGKTTLLRLIAGLEKPQAGSISINNTVVASENEWIKPEKRKVGMVFQDYALFPHLTVAENVCFGINEAKSARQKRMAEVLELVGLLGYEKRYPHQLSGGQQQRVAIARALAPRPELLLLDEPFSNLDELLKDQVRDELFDLLESLNITTLFVTHDTRDTLATADRIAVMKQGELQQYGQPQTLYYQPANEYVAVFLGKANLLPVKDGSMLQSAIGTFTRPNEINFLVKYICIRPESIIISDTGDELCRGIVKKIRFFGNYCEYTIAGADWQIIAKTKFMPEVGEGSSVYIQVSQYACLP
ncbi:ABC transporter ATP-binding protein [Rhodoflexus sp.]